MGAEVAAHKGGGVAEVDSRDGGHTTEPGEGGEPNPPRSSGGLPVDCELVDDDKTFLGLFTAIGQ